MKATAITLLALSATVANADFSQVPYTGEEYDIRFPMVVYPNPICSDADRSSELAGRHPLLTRINLSNGRFFKTLDTEALSSPETVRIFGSTTLTLQAASIGRREVRFCEVGGNLLVELSEVAVFDNETDQMSTPEVVWRAFSLVRAEYQPRDIDRPCAAAELTPIRFGRRLLHDSQTYFSCPNLTASRPLVRRRATFCREPEFAMHMISTERASEAVEENARVWTWRYRHPQGIPVLTDSEAACIERYFQQIRIEEHEATRHVF
jgi:hypothetical protein